MRLTAEDGRTQNDLMDSAMPGTEKGAQPMKARKGLFGVVAAVAAFWTAPARAAEPEDSSGGPGKAYLVSVGVGKFKDPAIHPRPTADADAKALYDLLTGNKPPLPV